MDQLVKFLGNLQSYFNDFIGAVAPAIVLALCLPVASHFVLPDLGASFWGGFYPVVVTVLLFAIGHLLLAVSEEMRERGIGPKEWAAHKKKKIDYSAEPAGAEFVRLLKSKGLSANANLPSNVIRNVAMTISDDGRELGRRFTFIALFCYGSGTAALVSGIAGLITSIVNALFVWTEAEFDWNRAIAIVIAIGSWWLLLRRGFEFEKRAGNTPISTALAEVLVVERDDAQASKPKPTVAP